MRVKQKVTGMFLDPTFADVSTFRLINRHIGG